MKHQYIINILWYITVLVISVIFFKEAPILFIIFNHCCPIDFLELQSQL